jgi:hypothetical protein
MDCPVWAVTAFTVAVVIVGALWFFVYSTTERKDLSNK